MLISNCSKILAASRFHRLLVDDDSFANRAAEEDVFRDGELVDEIELLVDDPDSVFGGGDRCEFGEFLALDDDGAFVR